MNRIFLVLAFAPITTPFTPKHRTSAAMQRARAFENAYLRIRVLPGWTVSPQERNPDRPFDCCIVWLTRGKYVLAIHPVFVHASGVTGGRVSEILTTQPSAVAVFGREDPMNAAFGYTQSKDIRIRATMELRNLYVDPSRMTRNCALLPPRHAVWFASFAGGAGPRSDYSIALTYNSDDLDALPRRDSAELRRTLRQVTWMLSTLRLQARDAH
ncbi:MAG: hypothetical protein ACLGXA_20950 [Acidobacteriota bacterium]